MVMYDDQWVTVRSAELIQQAQQARQAKEARAARRRPARARRRRGVWRLARLLIGGAR
jgi:hypothetical protein